MNKELKKAKLTYKAEEYLSAHRPLLDFLDLRFIERPSLKRSQFTSEGSGKTSKKARGSKSVKES